MRKTRRFGISFVTVAALSLGLLTIGAASVGALTRPGALPALASATATSSPSPVEGNVDDISYTADSSNVAAGATAIGY